MVRGGCNRDNDHGSLRRKSGPGINDDFVHFWVWIFVVVKAAKEIGRLGKILQN